MANSPLENKGSVMPIPIRYHFSQVFAVSAREAYEWCTDYTDGPEDHLLMGDETAFRHVARVAESTILLTETFQTEKGVFEKQKLVELYPDCLSWNSIHLTGSTKYSQYLYCITANDENISHLDFTGLHLDHTNENLTTAEVKQLANRLCKEDAKAWKLLAKAMAKDFKK